MKASVGAFNKEKALVCDISRSTVDSSTVQPELGSVGGVEEDRGVWLYYTFTMVSVSADNTSPCLVSTSCLSWRLAVHMDWMCDLRGLKLAKKKQAIIVRKHH